jgi:hypothetical protein
MLAETTFVSRTVPPPNGMQPSVTRVQKLRSQHKEITMADNKPAQERETYDWCPDCGQTHVLEHDCPIVPAASAPSQSAREDAELWLENHGNSWLKSHADLFVAFAAQQLAAKDAEISEWRTIRDVVVTLLVKVTGWTRDRVEESPFNAAAAAERARDSLREALAYRLTTVGSPDALLALKALQADFDEIADEALKAGKDRR